MKIQQKILEILTKTPKTFDVQMPAVLYKKNYDLQKKTWDILWMGPNFEKSTGFPYKTFKHDRVFWMKGLHPEDTAKTMKKLEELKSGKIDFMEMTYRWLHKDGTYHWFNDYAVLIRNEKNEPTEIIGSWVDISIYAIAEKIIDESEENYKKVVELSHHAIIVHNFDTFKFLNSAAIKLLGGTTLEDIIHKPMLEFIHPDYHAEADRGMRTIFEQNKAIPLTDYKIITLQGVVKNIEMAATPFIYQGKLAAQIVVVDVTKFKQVEALYRTNADELEHLNRILMKREGEQSSRGEKDSTASFNSETGILSVGSAKIQIQRFSKQAQMLTIIFKDDASMHQDWQFSEISEMIDIEVTFNWKKLYNIADAIRKNIAIETGIKNFFILTTQSIKINPQHVKTS